MDDVIGDVICDVIKHEIFCNIYVCGRLLNWAFADIFLMIIKVLIKES